MERQTTFRWLVAIDVFLGGTGAGLFLASFILNILGKFEPAARLGVLLGPIMVFVGTLFLLAELGVKAKFYRLIFNPSSWMSRGTWILAIFIIFGLAYALPEWSAFSWIPWNKATAVGQAIGLVAGAFSVLAMVYAGFLFGGAKRIPFWNTPALPLLFLLSGLYTGVAVLLLVLPFSEVSIGGELALALRSLGIVEAIFVLLQLFVLGAYLEIARHGDATAAESVRFLMSTPLFIAGVVIAGLIVPLALLFYAAGVNEQSELSILAVVAGVLLLAGGLLLRYCILRVGTRLPVHYIQNV